MLEVGEDKKIKLTYGALVFVVGTIITFTIWITGVESKAIGAGDKIANLDDRLDRHAEAIKEMRRKQDDINERTIRMEVLLKQIKRKAFEE